MNHETARNRLDALVDGELPATERAELEGHLAGCAACRDEVEEMRRLRSEARALPESVEPERDLWPGIVRHIAPAPARERRSWFEGWTQGLAWAAVLAVVLAGAYRLLAPRPEAPPPAAVRTGVMPAGLVPAVGALETQVAAAGKELQAALALRPDGMDAATGAALEANLGVLERAIAETRRAWEAHPDDPALIYGLTDLYRRKLDLLHEATDLVTRSWT
jgi:anti-sigma factor RsiW